MVCMCMRVCVCVCTCMCVYMYGCASVCVCMHVCVNMCVLCAPVTYTRLNQSELLASANQIKATVDRLLS